MLVDDLIYVALLLLCTLFGHYYRKLQNLESRQWVSTVVGLAVASIVSGWQMAHPVFCTLVNALIITKLSWRICHLVSFYFSFIYLLFIFRLSEWFGLPPPSGHTNLIQMILVLKLPGLAFEINNAHMAPENDVQGVNSPALQNLTFMDVVHYAFCFSGVLTGPYYRYRTYWDWLHRPFADKADHWGITCYKLKVAAFCCICYLITEHFYFTKYVLTEEFNNRLLLYRIFYMYAAFFSFRMRLYTGVILSECVCYMSGLGAYPTSCEPITGLGPRNYKAVEELSKHPDKIKKEDLDFETIYNMYIWKVETCYLVRNAMKLWNTCVQYWMATVVYKRFPSKKLRVPATLTLSSLWHGYAPGYFLTICQVALYLPVEDLCVKYYKLTKEGTLEWKIWTCALWFARITCMSYLGISFQLLQFWETISYYKSVYFIGHVVLLIVYIIGYLMKPYYLKKQEVEDKTKVNVKQD